MAYILFVFFLVFGLYVLFSILKNQIVIKNEYYKKKKYLETKIPFGYNELVNAIADAIEKEAKEGAEVTDHTILNYDHEERSFQEAFEEAKQLWAKLTENENVENLNKIHAIIKKHFGKVIKLSEVTENQLEPLEDVISDMREL